MSFLAFWLHFGRAYQETAIHKESQTNKQAYKKIKRANPASPKASNKLLAKNMGIKLEYDWIAAFSIRSSQKKVLIPFVLVHMVYVSLRTFVCILLKVGTNVSNQKLKHFALRTLRREMH